MASVVRLETKDLPDLWVVGKRLRVSYEEVAGANPIPAFWDKCMAEGVFETLGACPEVYSPDNVGFMWNWDDKAFDYLCGVLMTAEAEAPAGFEKVFIPAGEIAVSWIKGQPAEVFSMAHELTVEELAKAGQVVDNLNLPWCAEVYNCPRFTQPAQDGQLIMDYYIPIKK